MQHFVILLYAYLIGLLRVLLMSQHKLIQIIFIPGFNKIRIFNANIRAYYEFHKAKKNVPAYKNFLESNNFHYPRINGLVPQIL